MSSILNAMEPTQAYAAQPVTYAAQPAATFASTPMTYASAPVTYAAAPASTPITYAAAPSSTVISSPHPGMTYAAAPSVFAAAPSVFSAAPSVFTALPPAKAKLGPTKGAELRKAFNDADKDGSGALVADELSAVLRQCGLPVPIDIKTKFNEFDADGSGTVSFSEFMAGMHTKPPQAAAKNHEGEVDENGMWTDKAFPPNDNSVLSSPNAAADHVADIQAHAGGKIEFLRAGKDLCGKEAALFKSVHPNDIAQGVLGDCWFLAALAGLAEFEGAVFNLFQEKTATKDGKYTINIFNPALRVWDCVTIDDYVPCVKGEPIMAKPQDHEMWVLLLEKAFAKWFGSYAQIQGAYCMVAFMLLIDNGGLPCKVFSQSMGPDCKPSACNENLFTAVDCSLKDAKNRNSVGLLPKGQMDAAGVWTALMEADASNHIMAAWTVKDPPGGAAGVGASGEQIASDGIVKGHAYSLISAKAVTRDDGVAVKAIQLRNPWGANPAAEYKGGELADNWKDWGKYPKMKAELLQGGDKLDGMFWMTFEDFCRRYSDCGIVPKEMETFRMGQVAETGKPGGKHARRKEKSGAVAKGGKSDSKKGDKKSKKTKSCCK
jgi:hypothetical protein